jgi:hypothetical protein
LCRTRSDDLHRVARFKEACPRPKCDWRS